MSEDKTLKEIALELLEKYRTVGDAVIYEQSGRITEDLMELDCEYGRIRKQIEKAAEPKKGRWIGERKMNMTDIKTDAHSIKLLCNSLNAHYIAAAHRGDEILSILLFQAQGTITKLYEENCALKKAEEEE